MASDQRTPRWSKLDFLTFPSFLKVFDVLGRSAGKEKEFIEIPLTSQLRFAGRQTQVLGQLPRRKRTKGDNGYARFFGEGFQGVRSGRLLFSNRKAGETAEANRGHIAWLCGGRLGPQVKIVFWEKYAATIFRDERVGVRELAARFIHLKAGAACEPYGWDTVVIESGSEFIKARDRISAGWNQVVNSDVQNGRSLSQTVLRYACFHLSGDSARTAESREEYVELSRKGWKQKKRAGNPARFLPLWPKRPRVALAFTLRKCWK